jgi:uncharacterized protein
MSKKTPLRMCIACRQMKEKAELIKIVKNKEGIITLDQTGKLAGRGAYICKNEECQKKLQKQKLLNRAFSMNVDAQVYKQIEELYNIQS